MKKCPFCAEDIQDAAIVCKHCKRELVTNFTITLPDKVIEQANEDQLRRAVASLVSGVNEFLIVSITDVTYMQVGAERPGPGSELEFPLEYQDGSLDEHYQATEHIQAAQLLEVFSSYVHGSATWKEMFVWTKLDLSAKPEREAKQNHRGAFKAKPSMAVKKIRETRCTCASCGTVWHYGKAEALESTGAAIQNLGKSMMCCTGCAPAVFIPNQQVVDLNKCPKCGSKAFKKEIVEHMVP